ncbi:MAG: DUF3015 family protein [Bacteriovorax sp.]
MKKFLCFQLILFALGVHAEERAKNKGLIGENVDSPTADYYGMAGCGLGSVLFGESESRGVQLLSSTTNGTYSNNTFGMSSGTSNCNAAKPDKTTDIKKNIDVFVAANREALATDLAKNNGETIVALAQIVGCPNSQTMGSELKKNYETIFSTTNEFVVSNNLYNSVISSDYIVKNCQI